MAGRLSPVRLRSLTFAACATLLLAVVTVLAVAMPMTTVAAQPDNSGKGLAKGHAKGVVIVGYEPGTSKVKRGQAALSVEATDVSAISPLAPNTVVMKLPPGQTVEEAIAELEQQPGVRYAEPDYYVEPAVLPNDPYYTNGSLWGMHGDAIPPLDNDYGTGADEAWAAGAVGSPSVFVAVIDTGVQVTHPDLQPNMWVNPAESSGTPGVDDDGNGYIDDIHGWDFFNDNASVYDRQRDWHGTHVAGTIGARGDNGTGVAGVNWNVTIIPVKFLGGSGSGSGTLSDAVAALDYVTALKTQRGLNVVATNNSWGCLSSQDCQLDGFTTLQGAIRRAGDAGILFVAAAGNSGTNADTIPYYPAGLDCTQTAAGSPRGWDCIISVANIASTGTLNSSSNWGSTSVDLGAPGQASSARSRPVVATPRTPARVWPRHMWLERLRCAPVSRQG